MSTWYVTFDEPYAIEHHGIKGQKWGIRRFQNPDGTLTEEGQRRYSDYYSRQTEKYNKAIAKQEKARAAGNVKAAQRLQKKVDKYGNRGVESFLKSESAKKKAKVVAGVLAGVAALGVGAFLLSQNKEKASLAEKYHHLSEANREIETGRGAWEIARRAGEAGREDSMWNWADQANTNFERASKHNRLARYADSEATRYRNLGRTGLKVAAGGAVGSLGAAVYARAKDRNDRGKHRHR